MDFVEEGEEGEAAVATRCRVCREILEDDNVQRVRKNRQRRCFKCNNAAAIKRRKDNVISGLQHKFYNSASKRWGKDVSHLWSAETVAYVWVRWNKRSVLSLENRPLYLCITCYKILAPGELPTRNDLVIVTSNEAQSLAKMRDPAMRLAKFAPAVRDMIDTENDGPAPLNIHIVPVTQPPPPMLELPSAKRAKIDGCGSE